VKDVLPPAVSKWQYVEEKARAVLESFAYRELRTAGTLDRAYVVHARWQHEPVTRWYRIAHAGEQPRIEAAVFGLPAPTGDAEVMGMTIGLLSEIGIPASRLALRLGADDETRALLATLHTGVEPQVVARASEQQTFFEIHANGTRLAAGARNDELVPALGGPPVPTLVLEVDLEPVISAIDDPAESFEPPLTAFFACDTARARTWALQAAHRLRLDGIRAELEHDDLPLDEQRERAAILNARLTVVVHDEDLHAGHVLLEDHGTDRRELVALSDLDATIRQRVD